MEKTTGKREKKQDRPRLTVRVVRGLDMAMTLASADVEGTGRDFARSALGEMDAARTWLSWHQGRVRAQGRRPTSKMWST